MSLGYLATGWGYFGVGYPTSGTDPVQSTAPTAPPWASFSMPVGIVAYCSDEDVAERANADFPVLCPDWQKLAEGTDGLFAPGDPWVLQSGSVDFKGVGVVSGHVVLLAGPKPSFSGKGELFAVDSVTTGRVRLRRIKLPSGVGQPPAPTAGVSGVTFIVKTLEPQILTESMDANNLFGIDPNIPLNNPAAIYDPNRELVRYTALAVLVRQYTSETRSEKGDFALKLKKAYSDLGAVRDRLTVRWGSLGQAQFPKHHFNTSYRP
jgi:hypothetical protein